MFALPNATALRVIATFSLSRVRSYLNFYLWVVCHRTSIPSSFRTKRHLKVDKARIVYPIVNKFINNKHVAVINRGRCLPQNVLDKSDLSREAAFSKIVMELLLKSLMHISIAMTFLYD